MLYYKVREQDWYKERKMRGHDIAIEQYNYFENIVSKYVKNSFHEEFVRYVVPESRIN